MDEPPYPVALFINHQGSVSNDDEQRLKNLENQAGDPGDFTAIYHVSSSDQSSIYQAFADFTSIMLMQQAQNQRTSTDAYLEYDKTVKPKGGPAGGGALAANRGGAN